MYKFYTILRNEKGSYLAKGFENVETRLETEILEKEYAKVNSLYVQGVYSAK